MQKQTETSKDHVDESPYATYALNCTSQHKHGPVPIYYTNKLCGAKQTWWQYHVKCRGLATALASRQAFLDGYTDVLGNWWCGNCYKRCQSINLGHELGYPDIHNFLCLVECRDIVGQDAWLSWITTCSDSYIGSFLHEASKALKSFLCKDDSKFGCPVVKILPDGTIEIVILGRYCLVQGWHQVYTEKSQRAHGYWAKVQIVYVYRPDGSHVIYWQDDSSSTRNECPFPDVLDFELEYYYGGVDNLKQQHSNLPETTTVYHIGYSKDITGQSLESIMSNEKCHLIDTRHKAYSQMEKWRGDALNAKYGHRYHDAGKYLGNLNYKSKDGPIQIANLPVGVKGLCRYIDKGETLVLLCGCKEYEKCHRKVIVEELVRVRPEVSIVGI